MIVIDASAVLDAYLISHCRDSFIEKIRSNQLVIPEHFDAECLNGLRRVDMNTKLSNEVSEGFFTFLEILPRISVPVKTMVHGIWDKRHNITAYDAAYVTIAMATDSVLVTHDKRLGKAAQQYVAVERLDEHPAP